MATKSKFYVVWRGRETGIFEGWERCREQVEGYAGAQYKGYADWEQAHIAHQHSYWHETAKKQEVTAEGEIDQRSISVNAKCEKDGTFCYWGFETDTGNALFQSPEYKDGNMNVAQFLALIHALALLRQGGNDTRPIYTTSEMAIRWVTKGRCQTSLCRTLNNAKVFDLIIRANRWLSTNPIPNRILKWDTSKWGEMKHSK